MTKLASSLPDGHGLEAVRRQLLEDPGHQHVAIALINCSKVTTDYEKATKEPTAAIRTIEVVHPDDLELTRKVLTRGRDKRLGATVLPLDIEDEISAAFPSRSENVGTDLATSSDHLDEAQAKKLAESLSTPLRSELYRAIHALRESREWVTLGRARRVLQVVAARLEENDKRLLRDEDGRIVDPETGEVIQDEDGLTSEDIDRMLAALTDPDQLDIDTDGTDDTGDTEADGAAS